MAKYSSQSTADIAIINGANCYIKEFKTEKESWLNSGNIENYRLFNWEKEKDKYGIMENDVEMREKMSPFI